MGGVRAVPGVFELSWTQDSDRDALMACRGSRGGGQSDLVLVMEEDVGGIDCIDWGFAVGSFSLHAAS